MVFGFGEGSIELKLDKTNFAFGETVQGKFYLKLKKEKQARQLRVRLEALQTQRTGGPALVQMGGSRRRGSSQTTVLYQTEVILDGEKLYSPLGKEYEFNIQVPAKSALPAKPEGGLGNAIKTMQLLSGSSTQLKWYVNASLDIPGGRDISKRIQVSIQ